MLVRPGWLRRCLLAAVFLSWGAAALPLTVDNVADGEVLRYPVALLRGTLADAGADAVVIANLTRAERVTALAHKGKFIGLIELAPGANELLLSAGREDLRITLHYRPQTNPYVVRMIYFTGSDGATDYQTPLPDDPQNFRGKLATAAKLLQTFTAECLNNLGLGRRTFNLEFDERGEVLVHVLRGDKTSDQYRALDGGQLFGEVAAELARKLPHPTASNLVIPAFTRFDPATGRVYAHTALGGGNLALFGGGNLFAWPDSIPEAQKAFMNATIVDPAKVFSDSVGRHAFWAIASTTIGAALHELGHTFGLPHSTDPYDIMTRGHDHLNRFFTLFEPPHAGRPQPYEFPPNEVAYWAPVSARLLAASRFFALDARQWSDEARIDISVNRPTRAVVVQSPDGLRYFGVYRVERDGGVVALFDLPLPERATAASVPLSLLGKRTGTPNLIVRAADGEGNFADARLTDLLKGPFVQAWHFAPETVPWESYGAFPDVSRERLEQLQAMAASAPLSVSAAAFVDFRRLAPGPRRENVAAYAFRVIRTDTPRRVKLLTGSDDALRVWVNGRLVVEKLVLRSARADEDETLVDLQAGENRLLVEVAQGLGGWGLFLRMEDEAGRPLELRDDGTLSAVDDQETQGLFALLRGPYVRRWQFAPTPRPWANHAAFVPLTADDVSEIVAAARKADLSSAADDGPFVDFAAHFPEGQRTNVAGYALRIIRADQPTGVKLYTGSDDALRVWLNGRLILERLVLRSASPDADVCTADLQAGENVLLVEVSQAGGDWGLILRLEDADGRDLYLTDDGRLVPVPE